MSSFCQGTWEFEKAAAVTNVMQPEKLSLLLERYQGKSRQLPAHEGVDDTVYGSLEVYRREVEEELAFWIMNNGEEDLKNAFSEMDTMEKIHAIARRFHGDSSI